MVRTMSRPARNRALIVVFLAASWLLATAAGAQSPTPKDAWPILKAHFAEVERFKNTQDGNFSQLQDLMGGEPSFAGERARFVALWRVLGAHNDTAYYIWSSQNSSMGRSLRSAQADFAALDGMTKRFLELADQMATRRTPGAESEFRNYLARFSGTLDRLDQAGFLPVYTSLTKFMDECGRHGAIAATHNDAVRRAIDKFYEGRRGGEAPRQQLQRQREALFAFFAPWDAGHGRVIEAGSVVTNDWRRIHEDTAKLVVFLRSPTFIDTIPDIDARSVTDTINRIGSYLETYR